MVLKSSQGRSIANSSFSAADEMEEIILDHLVNAYDE